PARRGPERIAVQPPGKPVRQSRVSPRSPHLRHHRRRTARRAAGDAGGRSGTVRHAARFRSPWTSHRARALRLPRRQIRFHHRHLLGPPPAAGRRGHPKPGRRSASHHGRGPRDGAVPMRARGSSENRSRDGPMSPAETGSHIEAQKRTALSRRTVLTGLALGGLTAAGRTDSRPGGGREDVDISDPEMEDTIEFAAWESDFDWGSVIEAFNETYPNVTLQMSKTPFKDLVP